MWMFDVETKLYEKIGREIMVRLHGIFNIISNTNNKRMT